MTSGLVGSANNNNKFANESTSAKTGVTPIANPDATHISPPQYLIQPMGRGRGRDLNLLAWVTRKTEKLVGTDMVAEEPTRTNYDDSVIAEEPPNSETKVLEVIPAP